jgi:hypothetical protein
VEQLLHLIVGRLGNESFYLSFPSSSCGRPSLIRPADARGLGNERSGLKLNRGCMVELVSWAPSGALLLPDAFFFPFFMSASTFRP